MDEKNGKIAHQRIVAGRRILRNLGRNNNSPGTGSSQPAEPSRLPSSRAHFDDALLRHQFFDLLRGIGHALR
jgi:hypothetical protein